MRKQRTFLSMQTEEMLRGNEERFRSLVQHTSDIITILEADGTVRYVNPAIQRVLGYRPEEQIGTKAFDSVHPDDRERAVRVFAEVIDKPGLHEPIEFRVPRADGSWCYLEHVVNNLLDDPSVRGVVVSSRDTTERKKVEEELQEANRRLNELTVLRADFTVMVAHELDTPLAVIQGYVDMLAAGKLEPAEWPQVFAKIRAETDVLKALIADVRALTTIERADFAVELHQVPVGALLDAAAQFGATLAGDHPLTVENAADERVWADPHRVGQALRNLISNAAKYSPDGTPIELRAKPGNTSGRIRIEVVDSGVGVHPDDLSRIFEKFGCGRDKSGRKMAGTGLGLYLSRRIVQAHGSDLTVDSKPGGGSVFSFELEAV